MLWNSELWNSKPRLDILNKFHTKFHIDQFWPMVEYTHFQSKNSTETQYINNSTSDEWRSNVVVLHVLKWSTSSNLMHQESCKFDWRNARKSSWMFSVGWKSIVRSIEPHTFTSRLRQWPVPGHGRQHDHLNTLENSSKYFPNIFDN